MVISRKKAQGFSIIMAMFIIVVLGLLAAAMMSIMSAGSDSVAREVLSSRALMAAQSGAERKMNEIFPPGAAVNPAACSATNYTNFSGLAACSNASVVVSCTFVTVNTVNYFTVTSEGRCGPIAEPAVRVIEVQAKDTI